MKRISFLSGLIFIGTFSICAQIFNFSLRTNNQQLIDLAMEGAFVKVNQSYELCDTVSDERYGRNGKDYFSIIPFMGVKTCEGIVLPSAISEPWVVDTDFEKYGGKYKPLITTSMISDLTKGMILQRDTFDIKSMQKINEHLSIFRDTVNSPNWLAVDTVSGLKDGWLIWLSSANNLVDSDSVRLTSIKKEIKVTSDGEELSVEAPEIAETIYGGVFVTPVQTGIGHLVFTLTGVLVLNDNGWVLEFPFIKPKSESKALTPINALPKKEKTNPLNKHNK